MHSKRVLAVRGGVVVRGDVVVRGGVLGVVRADVVVVRGEMLLCEGGCRARGDVVRGEMSCEERCCARQGRCGCARGVLAVVFRYSIGGLLLN